MVSIMLLWLYPREKRPQYPLFRGLSGPKASEDVMEKRKICCPCQELNPDFGHPAHTLVAIPTELSWLT
jgi:hypothetical protein